MDIESMLPLQDQGDRLLPLRGEMFQAKGMTENGGFIISQERTDSLNIKTTSILKPSKHGKWTAESLRCPLSPVEVNKRIRRPSEHFLEVLGKEYKLRDHAVSSTKRPSILPKMIVETFSSLTTKDDSSNFRNESDPDIIQRQKRKVKFLDEVEDVEESCIQLKFSSPLVHKPPPLRRVNSLPVIATSPSIFGGNQRAHAPFSRHFSMTQINPPGATLIGQERERLSRDRKTRIDLAEEVEEDSDGIFIDSGKIDMIYTWLEECEKAKKNRIRTKGRKMHTL